MRILKTLLASAALSLAAPLCAAQEPEGFTSSGPWTQTVTSEQDVIRLDIATRFLVPIDGEGPTILFVGAIHIGDASYYALLQDLLDSQDLVLFEGVGGPGTEQAEPGSDEDKAFRSERRVGLLAAMAARYAADQGANPESVAAMLALRDVFDDVLMRKLRLAAADAWDNDVVVDTDPDTGRARFTSYGADGEPGGEGVDADLSAVQHEPGEEAAMYGNIAEMMGLTSQGERILTDQPHWVNSDMAWDDIAERFGEGDDMTRRMLEGLMDGEDPNLALIMEGLKRFLNASPLMKVMAKMMLVRTLGDESAMDDAGSALGEGFDHVIIGERNQVVIDDLKALLDGGTDARSIAVFYGAGHMEDLELRAYEQLGYRVAGGFWLPAVTLNLADQGLSEGELNLLRRQLEQ